MCSQEGRAVQCRVLGCVHRMSIVCGGVVFSQHYSLVHLPIDVIYQRHRGNSGNTFGELTCTLNLEQQTEDYGGASARKTFKFVNPSIFCGKKWEEDRRSQRGHLLGLDS